MNKKILNAIGLILMIHATFSCSQKIQNTPRQDVQHRGIQKLEYNNPGLLVDLDVGFKSVPLAMDFDGDGDIDLLVSAAGSYVESGIFYFENISGNVDHPVFRQGQRISSDRFRLGYDGKLFEVSEVDGHVHILTPDRANEKLIQYADVPENVFWKRKTLPLSPTGHVKNTSENTWKMIDFDGDGFYDLMSSASTPKGDFLLFFQNRGANEKPEYAPPEKIKIVTGEPIGQDYYLEVPLADYDGDGDLDYVAVTPFGKLIYFQNKGTSSTHKYQEGTLLKYQGEDLQFYSRYGSAIKLRAVDFNQDGHMDIIAGDEEGKVSFLQNTGKVKDGIPVFLPPVFFQQEAKYVDLGALAAPRVFDWDGDGLDDIISGNGAGDVLFVKNLGGKTPAWDAPQLLKAGNAPLRILQDEALPNTEEPHWGYTTIDVGDWNNNGLPDILVNDHNGNIVWVENTGTRKEPRLEAPRPLYVDWEGEPQKPAWTPGVSQGNELLAPWRTSPFIMDFNDDGLPDLVMLDYEGYLAIFPRYEEKDTLYLGHPQRNFIYPDGEPVLLNQLTGSSHGRLKITFADWDGDGLKDLIFSSKPAVDWMKNLGMRDGKMVLQYMGRVVSRTLMGHTDGPVTPDFNQDGIPDLLVGTETGVLYYWERWDTEVTSTMKTDGKQEPANYEYFKR